jgi:hypothetical protein
VQTKLLNNAFKKCESIFKAALKKEKLLRLTSSSDRTETDGGDDRDARDDRDDEAQRRHEEWLRETSQDSRRLSDSGEISNVRKSIF